MEAGGADLKKCFQCATCTSTCSLSSDEGAFPRKQVLLAQWGMKKELLKDPAPWLCFYCGECSKRVPAGGQPRRDDDGAAPLPHHAVRLDRTLAPDVPLGVLGDRDAARWWLAVVVGLFTLPQNFGFGLLQPFGPAAAANVMLDKFAPKEMVHLGDCDHGGAAQLVPADKCRAHVRRPDARRQNSG